MFVKQRGRAATSVGASIWEADAEFTDSDFAHELSLARKEVSETHNWLELILRAQILSPARIESLRGEASELTKVLGPIVRKTQVHIRNEKLRR